MTIKFDPNNAATINNATESNTNNQEVTTMTTLNVREELNFKSKVDIINSVKAITDDEFLTVQKWEFDAIKSIVAGKVTADQVVAKIGDVQTSGIFDRFLNEITIVNTITPKDDLFALIEKDANKRPIGQAIPLAIGQGLVSVWSGIKSFNEDVKTGIKVAKGDVTVKSKSPKF